MSELIRSSSPIHAKLIKLVNEACKNSEVESNLMAAFTMNVDSEDMPDDMEAALKGKKKDEDIYIFDDGAQKWLIPATSEKDAFDRVKAVIKGEPVKLTEGVRLKKWTIMTVDDRGNCTWGKGEGKPRIVEAADIKALNEEFADPEEKPFKVKDGVWLLQCPPAIILAIEEK